MEPTPATPGKATDASAKANVNAQHLLAHMPQSVCVITAQGTYLQAHGPSAHGRESSQLAGKHLSDIWPAEQATQFAYVLKEVAAKKEPQTFEYWLQTSRHNKSTACYQAQLVPLIESAEGADDANAAPNILWLATDITERKRAEIAFQTQGTLVDALAKAMMGLLSSQNFDGGIERYLANLGRAFKAERTYLWVPTARAPGTFTLHSQWHAPLKTVQPINTRSAEGAETRVALGKLFPEYIQRLESGSVVRIDGHEGSSNPPQQTYSLRAEKVFTRYYNMASGLFLPVFVNFELWGILCVDAVTGPRRFQHLEVTQLRGAAASLGAFVHNHQYAQQLQKARKVADEANAAKGDFLAMMSHEIRTPMNAILGFNDLLAAMPSIEGEAEEYTRIIRQSGHLLLELINQILDFSKMESRGLELEPSAFNPEMMVLETLELIRVKANEKGLELKLDMPPLPQPEYIGDGKRLRQVLLNLVGNAIKFTETGHIAVTANIEPAAEQRTARLHVSVSDTGVGMPEGAADKLFQPFAQVKTGQVRAQQGTGLGLVISKRIVEKMNGSISVSSTLGTGSTFSFQVDLATE